MHKYVPALTLVIGLFCAAPALAQEKGKVGMTFGAPASIGILWHATEKVALRPEFALSWSSSDVGPSESDTTSFNTGISALFYLARRDSLSMYLSPRYTFGRSSSSFSGSIFVDPERVTRTHAFTGSFGAQYALGDRFGAFGEFGLSYATVEPDAPVTTSQKSVATRTAAGLVLYF